MEKLSVEEKIKRHIDFWEGNPQKRPLVCVRIGDHFFSRQFSANFPLLEKGHIVTPEQINVDDYLDDYERMYLELQKVEHDAFFCAEPCTGFPWIEAIFGAEVVGNIDSFITRPVINNIHQLKKLRLEKNNPWYKKYIEFVEKLTEFAGGRFPVGQPILRGVTDTVGALIGQVEMVYGLIDEPQIIAYAFNVIANAIRQLVADQYSITKPFYGGWSIGFYHIWVPDKVIWYQEDLASLLSPEHFEQYLYATSTRILEGYNYSLVHLHPASFQHIDIILRLTNLKAVQLNKDVGGPKIRDMIPVCKKIIESGKRVILGMGPIDKDDIDAIYDGLPNRGVAINIIAKSVDEANDILEYMSTKKWGS